jgi:DNA mismatch repair protein MutL
VRAAEIPLPESSSIDVPHHPSRSFASPPQMEFPVPDLNISEPSEEPFRIIGPLGAHWIILEGKDGLVLLDVRAASERILFENLRKDAASGNAASQNLLLPSIVDLTPKDAVWISENLRALELAGFHLEPFGGDSFKVEAIPACLALSDIRDALLDVCLTLRSTGLVGSSQPVVDALIRSVSRFASSNGFQYGESRAMHLVRELLKCELPYACPQGRPTLIQWSFSELERKFGR